MLEEYKKFAIRGNVIDMAVGIIIGAAFGTLVQSLVTDVLTPPLGLLTSGTDVRNLFVVLKEGAPEAPYVTLQAAQDAGAVTINMGMFINAFIGFLIVSFAVFLLVRYINQLRDPDEGPPPPRQSRSARSASRTYRFRPPAARIAPPSSLRRVVRLRRLVPLTSRHEAANGSVNSRPCCRGSFTFPRRASSAHP